MPKVFESKTKVGGLNQILNVYVCVGGVCAKSDSKSRVLNKMGVGAIRC